MTKDDFIQFINNFVSELTITLNGEAYFNNQLVAKVEI